MTDKTNDAQEEAALEGLGYQPALARTMNFAKSTMVSISTSSVTTAMFTLFGFGLVTGGTSFVWTYLIGYVVLLAVTMMFAELGSSMPIAGAIYPWATKLLGARVGYAVGWLYVAAYTAITAAIAFGVAPWVAALFRIEMTTGQQTLFAVAIIVVSTIINLVGIRLASFIGSLGAIAEVAGMLVLIGVLAIAGFGNQSPSILVEAHGVPAGSDMTSVFLLTMLFGAWAYTGLEMTSDMAEETHNARDVIPKAAFTSVTTTFVVGFLFLVVAVLAIPDLNTIFTSANPLQDIIEGNTTSWFYSMTTVLVIVAVFVAGLTNQALTSRALFALARDGKVPAAKSLAHVPPSTQVPALAIVVVGALACAMLMFTDAIGVIAVACLTALFTCYMIVIWAQLVARLRGTWRPTHWNMGRLSLPVNIFAAVFGTALTLDLAWPRGDASWYERWAGWLFTGAILVAAVVNYAFAGAKGRKTISRLGASHRELLMDEASG